MTVAEKLVATATRRFREELAPEGEHRVRVTHECCDVCDGRGFTYYGPDDCCTSTCWYCKGNTWRMDVEFIESEVKDD